MNSRQTFLATALLACCFLVGLITSPALAAAAKKAAPPPDVRTLIKSVDKANNSLVIISNRDKVTHQYRLDDLSTIQVDGGPAKFADIKAGMEVSASTERDSDTLDSISLVSKSSAPTIADAKKPTVTGSSKTIQTILADKSSIVIYYAETKTQRTYRVDGNTQIQVNGSAGTFSDLKVGMTVKDFMERDADDLDSLVVGGGY